MLHERAVERQKEGEKGRLKTWIELGEREVT